MVVAVLRVVGSILTARVKVLSERLNSQCLCLLSSTGYQVEREKNAVNGIKQLPFYVAWLHSSQGDEAVYVCTCEFHNQAR